MKHFVLALITTLIFIALVAGVSEPETRMCKAKNTIPVLPEPVSLISGEGCSAMGFRQKGIQSDSTAHKSDPEALKPIKKKEPDRKGTTVKKPVTKYC